MMVHDQFKNQDTRFFNQHKNETLRIPKPSLPNGQRPDFGNGNNHHSNSNRSRKPQSQPQQSLPNGHAPDFGNGNVNSSNRSRRPRSNNNNNNNNSNSTAGSNGPKPKNNNNRSKNNKNQKKSPLSSPKNEIIAQINNYQHFSASAPSLSGLPIKNSNTPNSSGSFAGASYTSAPETNSLPKPSFL